jgi:hypothetical protein
MTRWLGALACCIAAGSALAQSIGWQYKNGNAKDIGAGADGSVWVISSGGVGGGDYKIYRYVNGRYEQKPGGAVRIDVGPDANAWVINYQHDIYRWNPAINNWTNVPGKGLDIGVGGTGSGQAWLIGTDYSIYRLDARAGWVKMPGRAVRIDVDPKGIAWVVNEGNDIYRWNGGGWDQVPGKARDIGIGSEGSVWIAGTDGAVWKYNGYDWSKSDGNLVNITVDNRGNPWGVNSSDQIWGASGGAGFQLPLARPPQGPAPEAVLPADQEGYVFTYNHSRYAMWVTLYKNMSPTPLTKIVESACVPSNGAKLWRTELANSLSYTLRAELMVDDNCHSPVVCDTKVKIDSFDPIALYNYATLSAPQGCWWDVSVKRR